MTCNDCKYREICIVVPNPRYAQTLCAKFEYDKEQPLETRMEDGQAFCGRCNSILPGYNNQNVHYCYYCGQKIKKGKNTDINTDIIYEVTTKIANNTNDSAEITLYDKVNEDYIVFYTVETYDEVKRKMGVE